ncbi:ACP S-malonyltransferase [Fructilactobacillus myrtifloralis]|uniref:Malonyl CoA-acyl carrier protein transacylase n=1 Tax=Fructilactobacillus myrtifloralis TaxID=2940301 RepID=A0ABY5BM70_9LACO|nr:ACP S-malonyltransferase [Fructilactobacillus myrtifloralis]USS84778.1 ACP S-malonyltransferase [Fructilactobacillus myrtifloralis]
MTNVGYLFSGQGSQFPEMGLDLYTQEPQYRAALDQVHTTLGIDLTDPEQLNHPQNVQVAILAMSYGISQILAADGITPQAMMGLSLGEYSALVASGAFQYPDALALVHDRSHYMEEAGAQNPGAMAAVLKLAPETVTEVVADLPDVYPANYNTASQTVIGGTTAGIAHATLVLQAAGAKRVVQLPVAVASHTPLMQPASDQLQQRLQAVPVHDWTVPVISNTTQVPFTAATLKATLTQQLVRPTHFQADLEYLHAHTAVDTLIEIGPGDTLTRFAKKTVPELTTYHVDSVATLAKVRAELNTEVSK